MKQQKTFRFCDEIQGKECKDYIKEFSPKRLKTPIYFEDSETIFDLDEEKTVFIP